MRQVSVTPAQVEAAQIVAAWQHEHGEPISEGTLRIAQATPLLSLDDDDGCGGYLNDCARLGQCQCDRLGRE